MVDADDACAPTCDEVMRQLSLARADVEDSLTGVHTLDEEAW